MPTPVTGRPRRATAAPRPRAAAPRPRSAARRSRATAAAVLVGLLAAAAGGTASATPTVGTGSPGAGEGGRVALPGAALRQAGTYDALAAGMLDGRTRVGDVVRPGSIGLGTFDGLDGEAVIMDGTAYRVGTGGTPRVADPARHTPFMQAMRFRPQATRSVPAGTACADLGPLIDAAAGTSAGVVGVRVTGRFADLVMRSVPAQADGTDLTAAVADQVVFPLGARRATLVGFRSGADLAGLTPTGVHLHGLTRGRDAGGHVLSCTVRQARLEVDVADGVRVVGR